MVAGQAWISRSLATLVAEAAAHGAEVVAVDPWWRWADPDRVVTTVVRADPGAWLRAAAASSPGGPAGGGRWRQCWDQAEAAAQAAIDAVLTTDARAHGGRVTEPAVARHLLGLVGPQAAVVTASSMPVRDLEWFSAPRPVVPRVLANRGANGIDGVTSTARGVAAAVGGPPVVALVGDLAFLHDVSALVQAVGPVPGHCTVVVVDNGGGGIFSFLAQAGALERSRFETLFATPQATSVAEVAAGFGLPVTEVATVDGLAAALDGRLADHPLAVVRVAVPDRATNVALHQQLHDAVALAVGQLDLA